MQNTTKLFTDMNPLQSVFSDDALLNASSIKQ